MKKEKNESIPNKNSLEWHERYYVVYCEWCEERLIVHAFRRETKGKEKIVYAHCTNGLCPKKGVEISHLGDPAKPEKWTYEQKVRRIKEYMTAPRMRVSIQTRMQARNAHMGAGA